MKKKIFLSILFMSVVGGVGIAATRAFFSNRETSTGSTFTVGTLDLKVGDADGTNIEPFIISGIGSSSDISGEKTWTVKNVGSLPGRLYINLKNVVNYENGCNEPEAKEDITCANPGAGEGELGDVVVAKIYLDGVEQVSSNLNEANVAKIGTDWSALEPIVLEGGTQKTIKIDWKTLRAEYGNEIQSDSLTFDVDFDLVQLIN